MKELQQLALSSMSDCEDKGGEANDCVNIVNELRSLFQQYGTPEPQTVESSRVYQLLFATKSCKTPMHKPQELRGGDAAASPSQDLHFGVDVSGSAFGPSKGTKAAQTPYTKVPASGAAGTSGKGIGAPGEVTPLTEASKH